MWLRRAESRCAREPTSCLLCAAFRGASVRRRLRRVGRASSFHPVSVQGSWRENYSGLVEIRNCAEFGAGEGLPCFALPDRRDARPPLNLGYSMLEPSGVYLYLLPSQNTTDVA